MSGIKVVWIDEEIGNEENQGYLEELKHIYNFNVINRKQIFFSQKYFYKHSN